MPIFVNEAGGGKQVRESFNNLKGLAPDIDARVNGLINKTKKELPVDKGGERKILNTLQIKNNDVSSLLAPSAIKQIEGDLQ